MKHPPGTLVLSLFLLLLLPAIRASAVEDPGVEHPGALHKNDNCSSCHRDKTRGKSVHSAMAVACIVCHLAQTRGDMTTLNLEMPKEKICFSCHEKFMLLRDHSPAVKGLCVDCHDAHSSNRRMLLRNPADIAAATRFAHIRARPQVRTQPSSPAQSRGPGY
jgi:predicted CXXCH cytochrome family protein